MKRGSLLLLLNSQTRELYAFATTFSWHSGVGKQKEQAPQSDSYQLLAGRTLDWTYFLIVSMDTRHS